MKGAPISTNVRTLALLGVAVGVSLLSGCRPVPDTRPDMVSAWTRTWYGAIRVERLSPPVASRAIGIAATALYAGLSAVDTTLRPLNGVLNALPALPHAERPGEHDATVVATAAERTVLDSLWLEALPTTRAAFKRLADSLASDRTARGVSPEVSARSDALGTRIGQAIVAWSRTDGFAGTRGRPYPPPEGRGVWYNDAPATIYATQNLSGASEFVALDNPANQQRAGNTSDRGLILSRPKNSRMLPAANMAGATEPYWREVRPFVLASWRQCPVPEPMSYDEDSTSAMYRDARAMVDAQAHLTDEQSTIALYWADNAGETGTPSGHWLLIASQMISEQHMNAPQAARMVLATAVAQADAFIAAWGYKFEYVTLRPRVYIRRLMDPKWEPLIPTPPFPEHPAGHSTQSAAAATVLTAFLGAIPFTDSTSISIGHAVRHFDSFTAASVEAGMSRVYGGIHFPHGNDAGRELGTCIGTAVVNRFGVGSAIPSPRK